MRALEQIKQNGALWEQYEAIGELLVKSITHEASRKYEIGRRINLVMANPDKYGQGAIALIAKAIGKTKPDFLYNAGKVAHTWSKLEFEALLSRPTCHRVPLSFSHFVLLAQSGKSRDELLEKALEHGWSVKELQNAMPKKRKTKRLRSADPKKAVRSVNKMAELLNEIQEWPRMSAEEAEPLIEALKAMGAQLLRRDRKTNQVTLFCHLGLVLAAPLVRLICHGDPLLAHPFYPVTTTPFTPWMHLPYAR